MSYQELLAAIKKLPLDERLLLLQAIAESVRREVSPPKRKEGWSGAQMHGIGKPSSSERVRGMLEPDDGTNFTDEELKEMYVDALIEKYGK